MRKTASQPHSTQARLLQETYPSALELTVTTSQRFKVNILYNAKTISPFGSCEICSFSLRVIAWEKASFSSITIRHRVFGTLERALGSVSLAQHDLYYESSGQKAAVLLETWQALTAVVCNGKI